MYTHIYIYVCMYNYIVLIQFVIIVTSCYITHSAAACASIYLQGKPCYCCLQGKAFTIVLCRHNRSIAICIYYIKHKASFFTLLFNLFIYN